MSDQSLRDRLLDLEHQSPELKAKYQKELKKMMEKKLTTFGKIMAAFSVLLGCFFVVFFSYQALTLPPDLPFLARVGFAVGALFGGAWAVLGIWTLRRGSMNVGRFENTTQGLVFGFVLFMLIITGVTGAEAQDRIKGLHMILSGLTFFLVFGVPALFNMRINRTETLLREQLLKIELKLAELAERMQAGK